MTERISGDLKNLLKCEICKYREDDGECSCADSNHYGHLIAQWHIACSKFKPIRASNYNGEDDRGRCPGNTWDSKTGLCLTCGFSHPGASSKSQYVMSDKLKPVWCSQPLIHGTWDSKTGRCRTCGWPHPNATVTIKEVKMPEEEVVVCNTPKKHIWWDGKTGLCTTCGLPHPGAIREVKEMEESKKLKMKLDLTGKQAMEKTEHEKHIERHKLLHGHADELIADYLTSNSGRLMSKTNLVQLLTWSYSQVLDPDDPSKPSKHIF